MFCVLNYWENILKGETIYLNKFIQSLKLDIIVQTKQAINSEFVKFSFKTILDKHVDIFTPMTLTYSLVI